MFVLRCFNGFVKVF